MDTVSAPPAARTAILEAATELFATKGLAATTIKAIGASAGVNSALIYYYFTDKADLYDAVLGRMAAAFPGRLSEVAATADSPAAGLAAVVRAQAEVFLAEPRMARLIARELADHDGEKAHSMIREQARGLLERICGLIRAGQQRGEFRTDLEPELLAVSVLSQVNWFCIAGPIVEMILQRDGASTDPTSLRKFANHVVRFSMAGLEPIPQESAA